MDGHYQQYDGLTVSLFFSFFFASIKRKPILLFTDKSLVISNDTVLVLEKITADMEGFYNCTAINPLGHIQKVYYIIPCLLFLC